jgi:glycosyltransferase involved in cell wall biosynthesis
LRIIYDVDGWAWHRQALCLQKYAAADFDVSLHAGHWSNSVSDCLGETPPDVLFVFGNTVACDLRDEIDRRGWATRLVVRWTTGWPDRLGALGQVRKAADLVVFNNEEYWRKSGRLPKTAYLANGVDLETFKIGRPIGERKAKVLWCGSRLHSRLKGYDDLLIPLRDAMAQRSIDCDLLLVDSFGNLKLSAQQMANWYNGGSVYVCASRTEGTPNVALEAAACGCTIVSTAVGNMPELVRDGINGYLVEHDVDALCDGVLRAIGDYAQLAHSMQVDITAWAWKSRAAEFYDLFREAVATPRSDPPIEIRVRPDISGELTVFLQVERGTNIGAAVRRLQDQECRFRIELIEEKGEGVVRDWLSSCRTAFFAVVPSNVLLEPNAIPSLFEGIRKGDPKAAMFVGLVTDDRGGIEPQGIAIFRHAVVERATSNGETEAEVGLLDILGRHAAAEAAASEDGRREIPAMVVGRRTGLAHGDEPRLP